MTATASPSVPSVTPQGTQSRSIKLLRVVVLLAAGMVITFTAPQHEQLGFDVTVTALALAAIGLAHAVAWLAARSRGGSPATLLLTIVALAAAAGLIFTESTTGYAVVVAAWALVSALLEFIGATVRQVPRTDAFLTGAAGVLLALFTLLAREDAVAVLGFFGAYAIIVGVFLGISAFDSRGAATHPTVSAPTDSAADSPS
ncbi:hypothetical protein ACXR2T_07195 [Leucobacter sp. HY1910]